MDCNTVQELLIEYINGHLSLDVSLEVKDHLQLCVCCLKEYTGIRKVWRVMDMLPDIEPSSDLKERILGKFREERKKGISAGVFI